MPHRTPTSNDRATRKPSDYPTWNTLLWFGLARLLLAGGLALVFASYPPAAMPGTAGLTLTAGIIFGYAMIVLIGVFLALRRWPAKERQVQASIVADIGAFTALMYVNGGVESGLGPLLAISVAAAALMMEGKLSLLVAAVVTVSVIGQELYIQFDTELRPRGFTHAGLLGLTFFAVALLGHVLYKRIQVTRQIARRREVDLADLSQLNEFIIQRLTTGVLVLDDRHRLRLMNAAARRLLGRPSVRTGARLGDVAPELTEWLFSPDANQTIVANETELKATAQIVGENPSAGVLIFLRDNRELQREAQQVKLAALGRLTASIAHNLRNPLAAISHASQLLTESPSLNDEDKRLLDIVRRNSARIDEIIESVLEVSRRGRPNPRSIPLVVWLTDFCADYRQAHNLSAERLAFAGHPVAAVVRADNRHLHQVLTNLCDNALKHGRRNDHLPRIRIELKSGRTGGIHLDVCDDGPGITGDVVKDIFNPFFTTSADGTGLGLYIARELAQTNGLDLEYIDHNGRGSCFRLTFPRQVLELTGLPESDYSLSQ